MNEDGDARGSRRYVALDIHKHYGVVAGVDRDGRVVLHWVRVEHANLEGWLKKNLQASDHVVIESTQKTARIIQHPDRFSLLLLVLTFFLLTA